MSRKTSLFYVLLLSLLSFGTAYKYLAILHTAAKSHHNVGSALMKGLARQGHEVTVVSPFPLKNPPKNYYDVSVPTILSGMKEAIGGLLKTIERNIMANVVDFHHMGLFITKTFLDDPNVQKLLKSNKTFDAIICEVFLNEAHFGLSEYYNAPLIGLGTFGAISWNTDMVGSPSPPSYVPHALLRFSDHMSFVERVGNLGMLTFERLFLEFYYLPKQEAIYKEYFPNNKQPLRDIRKNAALVLLNQHVSLSFPRPYSPNMIEVGGMHINRKRSPLPADIEKFINEAEHGVIYFSMGSNLQSKDLPIEKRREILNTFRGLKQRVLWKFEEPNLADKPNNVYISGWFPQDDILAHEKVLAFVTHGGLLSTTESIYHAKPFIGLPIFGDQFLNMRRAEKNGYGIMLDYTTLTAEKFKAAIAQITSEPSYTQLVRAMSARYKDQKEEPLDRAIYWVEHVTRHKGANYLRSASQDLNFIQYHNLDAIFVLYGGIFFVLCIIVIVIRRIFLFLLSFIAKDNQEKGTRKVKRN